MKYALLIYGDDAGWADLPDEEKVGAPRGRRCRQWLIALRGARQGGSERRPARSSTGASTAKVVRVRDGERIVTDGPVRRDEGGHGRPLPRSTSPTSTRRSGSPPRSRREGTGLDRDPSRAAIGDCMQQRRRARLPGGVEHAVAILTRVLGDLELAEDAVQDAFATALERWPREGLPRTPGAWIVTTARNRAIDRIRREKVFQRKAELIGRLQELPAEEDDVSAIPDERLALVFTCCHPALAAESRVALTLREVGGLTTAEIAHAFLVAEPAMAQRLVRAKRKIRGAGHPVPRAARPPPARSACARCSPCSTSCSTRATRRRPAPTSCGPTSATRRSGSASCSPCSCRTSPRCSACSRSCSSRTRAAPLASAPTARSCCSRIRTGRSGIEARIDEGLRDARACRLAATARAVPAPGGDRGGARRGSPESRDRPPVRGARSLDPSPVVRLNHAVAVALAGDVDEGLALLDGDRRARRVPPAARGPCRPLSSPGSTGRGRRGVSPSARADDERGRDPVPGAAPSRGLVARAQPPRLGSPRQGRRRPTALPSSATTRLPSRSASAISAIVP